MSQPAHHVEIIKAWQSRAAAQGWKPRTATYVKHQIEFLLGAQMALQATGAVLFSDMALVMASVGNDPCDIFLRDRWSIGSNGNHFADMGGHRYCVALIDGRKNDSGFMVTQNGITIAGPELSGAPAGFKTVDDAKAYAERAAGVTTD